MPLKLSPGTPSIGEGVRTPFQWIELGSLRRLVTASVTVSPSRQRKMGAGTWALTAVAVVCRPLRVIGIDPISSANSVPLRTGAGAASACRSGAGISASAPAAAAPMKRRRVSGG